MPDVRSVMRWVVLGVVVVMAAVTLLYLRGPESWQRRYYPLAHETAIDEAAVRHKVSPYLIAAVISAESDWDAAAVSRAGAVGLMQVLPSTAEEMARRGLVDGESYPPDRMSDPDVSIEYGTAYLRYLVERYHEIEHALAAYNAGLARVDEWAQKGTDIREQIEFPETRHYVLKVVRAKERYETLYPDAFEGWHASE